MSWYGLLSKTLQFGSDLVNNYVLHTCTQSHLNCSVSMTTTLSVNTRPVLFYYIHYVEVVHFLNWFQQLCGWCLPSYLWLPSGKWHLTIQICRKDKKCQSNPVVVHFTSLSALLTLLNLIATYLIELQHPVFIGPNPMQCTTEVAPPSSQYCLTCETD